MTQITFKNNPLKLDGSLPSIGSRISNISFTKDDLSDIDLNAYKGSPLVLWFVPSLDTGTCILSSKKLNEHLKKHQGTKALILSMDLPFAQKRIRFYRMRTMYPCHR